jgi:CheY-like chemotaxis protein
MSSSPASGSGSRNLQRGAPELHEYYEGWNRRMTLPKQTVVVAEGDVIVRLALSEYLRACGFTVLEAADAGEAKAILQSGLRVDALISDAQLAGPENGFALAQWVRRNRGAVEVLLTTSIANKAQTAAAFCGRSPGGKPPSDAAGLAARIRAMLAERRRRARSPASPAPEPRRRTDSTSSR